MTRQQVAARFYSFLRLQCIAAGIIVASWLIFWAVENPVGSIRDLFIYVLTQINLTVVLLHPLKFFYEQRRVRYHWPLHIVSILAVNCVVVVASAVAIYRVNDLNSSFGDFLHHSWKFPFVANLVFAFAYETYKVTTRRLRQHNQQLQTRIDFEKTERQEQAEELRQALEIQRGLLPKQIPQLRGFQISAAWEPAKAVGGDYYDVIRLSKQRVAICIADVSGKGISAALLMANVQAAVRAFAATDVPPSQVCNQINRVLCTNTATDKFVTLFYGILDGENGSLTYTSAGHLPPLMITRNGNTHRLATEGAVLGVFPQWKYKDAGLRLGPGDSLLMFTDGITEAMSDTGIEFGEDRLVSTLSLSSAKNPEQLLVNLLNDVHLHCGARMSDDATLVIVSANSKPDRSEIEQPFIEFAGAQS